ncbi:ABC transporter substrate-binding protein [Paucibacter sp. TC2R-5]|uniref:ABC transporter substrate-binding protein n=1 Tax=Paucibacter sp. TC2R-5 TaxID=2893555 RepID=UPI0021E358D1|nr:ABC transporter substrate-binding protein [Paucibacter sp. TC2R-5]MCV2358701.1 ABC transporter substrate-binding protein [Paucibacter sp. TC2R-5]
MKAAQLAIALLIGLHALLVSATEPAKVLRYAFPIAETGFDPAQIDDLYSRTITAAIFESLYRYDHLARPVKLAPLVAAAMPEVASDFKTFTVRIKPGIYFAADPAFKGKQRELTAHDFVYSYKRFADPANKSPGWSTFEEAGLLGLAAQRDLAVKGKKPFDYAHEIEGLRALDRYTIQFRVEQARPRLVEMIMTGSDIVGAVAREVVEAYGDKLSDHPVGTGPFKLGQWRRSSKIELLRNPDYRERFYDAEPGADDKEGQALLAHFKGRRLPMLDRVEVDIIEEVQPRWLAFLNAEHDFLERVPPDFISQAMPGGKLAPNLAKRGVQAFRTVGPDASLTVFNMEDPIIGGMAPEKIALRRAISLGMDVPREISMVRRGQAIPAQSQVVPHTTGYSADFKSEMGDYDPVRAKALLDLYGYIDRDGDGWREQPDGQKLVLVRNTEPTNASRQMDELLLKNMRAIGLKIEFKTAKWPENMKSARGGKYMIWFLGSSASDPDGLGPFQRLYGPAIDGQNLSRFKSAEFDRLYEQMQGMADGPEREALLLQAKRLAVSYMPSKAHVHRIITDLAQPWLIGYRRALFWQDWWQYVDVDESKRKPQ